MDGPILHSDIRGGVATRNLDMFLEDASCGYLEELKNILKHKNVILSSEAVWQDIYWGWKRGKQMIKTLSELHDNIKVVVYLRRQDFYIEALWGEWVKYGATDLTLEEFESEMESQCDYNGRLDELAEIIGVDNIVVRLYEEEGFDTINDFMKHLDLENCNLVCGKARNRVNERTDIECLKLARICNSVRMKKQSTGMGLAMRKIFSEIADSKKEGNPDVRGKYFSPAERRRILSKWEIQNRALTEKYLNRELLFRNEKTEYPYYNPSLSNMEETIVKMFMLLEIRRQNTIKFFFTNREKKIAFWGAGTRCGEIVRNGLIPDIIIDNDRNLRGQQFFGILIVAVDDLDDLKNYCIVITIQNSQEICEQCRTLGLTEGIDFICGEDMI